MSDLKVELKQLIIDTLDLEDIEVSDIQDDEALFVDGLGLDSIDALELGLAIKKACQNIEKSIDYIKKLENRFIQKLNKYKIDYILHIEDRLPGVLTLGFPNIDGQSLLIALDLKGIAISFGSACSSGTAKASKILLDAGISENLAKSTLRISFGKIHNNKDIDYVAKELSSIINRIKK